MGQEQTPIGNYNGNNYQQPMNQYPRDNSGNDIQGYQHQNQRQPEQYGRDHYNNGPNVDQTNRGRSDDRYRSRERSREKSRNRTPRDNLGIGHPETCQEIGHLEKNLGIGYLEKNLGTDLPMTEGKEDMIIDIMTLAMVDTA